MSTVETNPLATDPLSVPGVTDKGNGPAVAAMIAAGIGSLTMGVFTTLAEASASIKDFLAWTDAVGPLAGKTGMAVIAWLVSWAILHVLYRNRSASIQRALIITLVLVGLGFVMTFPTFFQAFAPE
jgi:hypothetical protein